MQDSQQEHARQWITERREVLNLLAIAKKLPVSSTTIYRFIDKKRNLKNRNFQNLLEAIKPLGYEPLPVESN